MSRRRMPATTRIPAAGWLLLAVVSFSALQSAQTHGATPAAAQLVPLDGRAYSASLLRLEADGRIMLGVDGKPQTIPAGQWVRWGAPAPFAPSGPIVLAADGSLLPIDQQFEPVVLQGEKLNCDTRRLGRLQLPLPSVRGLVYHLPARIQQADVLMREILDAQGSADQLLLANGDRLSGTLTQLGADKLLLEVDQIPLELEVRNVVAVIFNPALARRPPATKERMVVGLSDGTRLQCQAAVSSGTSLSMTTQNGLKLSSALANVVWLQALSEKVAYVSDFQDAGYRHTPYLSLNWPYERDRNVLGGQLRCGGRAYLKGLGMHSTSLIRYALDKPYRRLDAEIGIDDETGSRGSVIFRVYVDTGDGQWQRRYESPIVRGGQAPVPISVDLKGAKRIALVADVADRGDELDHANWLDARLVP